MFIPGNPSGISKLAVSVMSKDPNTGLKCQGWDNYRNFVEGPSLLATRRLKQKSLTVPRVANVPLSVHPAQAMRAQFFATYIQRSLSSEHPPSTTMGDHFLLESLERLPRKNIITDTALSALSCIRLGKTDHDDMIFRHGLYLYNRAIRQVSTAITQGSYTNEVIYTDAVTQEIEVLHCPSGMSPLGTHVAGMNALLAYYKSKEKSDPIIDITRKRQKLWILTVVCQILLSSGMSLSKSEYNCLMEPTNGDPLLKILQATVTLGTLKAEIDSVDYLPPAEYQDKLQRCSMVQSRLMKLQERGEFGGEPTDFKFPTTKSQATEETDIPSTEQLFGNPFGFSSPDNAILYTLFWANLCILKPIIHRAHELSRSPATQMIESPTTPFEDLELALAEEYADKIARSMPYCFQESMKLSCVKPAFWSICMALHVYLASGNREKVDWTKKAFKAMAARGAYPKFLMYHHTEHQ
ncbi:hypothetical protein N7488_005176 [Penicillium malachiteum]|nr:hypothetical protein N7488_005176 [Penicillium malachiteum]